MYSFYGKFAKKMMLSASKKNIRNEKLFALMAFLITVAWLLVAFKKDDFFNVGIAVCWLFISQFALIRAGIMEVVLKNDLIKSIETENPNQEAEELARDQKIAVKMNPYAVEIYDYANENKLTISQVNILVDAKKLNRFEVGDNVFVFNNEQ